MQGSCLPGRCWSSSVLSFCWPSCQARLTSGGRVSALRLGAWKKSLVTSLVRPELPGRLGEPVGANSLNCWTKAPAPRGSNLAFQCFPMPWQCLQGLSSGRQHPPAFKGDCWGEMDKNGINYSNRAGAFHGTELLPGSGKTANPPAPAPEPCLLQGRVCVPGSGSSSPAPPQELASHHGLCGA